MNLTRVSRDGYTYLDWISDIGGIQGILISAMAIIIGLWNYNYLDSELASKLYRVKEYQTNENLRFGAFSGVKDFLCDLLPSCFQCCRGNPNARGLIMGREKLA